MARVKRDLAILLVHLIATIAKLMGPGGVRSIEAIVETKRRNPRWGCRRIAQQLSIVFVIDIDKDVECGSHALRIADPRGQGGQDRALRAALTPLRRTAHWALRREFLDQVPFWNARDLERKRLDFKDYFNCQRAHHALGGITPTVKSGETPRTVVDLDNYRWRSHCGGLYQLPAAA
jgi:hypothetical protein